MGSWKKLSIFSHCPPTLLSIGIMVSENNACNRQTDELVSGLAQNAITARVVPANIACAVILEVRNTSNLASWRFIRKTLSAIGVPTYLTGIVCFY